MVNVVPCEADDGEYRTSEAGESSTPDSWYSKLGSTKKSFYRLNETTYMEAFVNDSVTATFLHDFLVILKHYIFDYFSRNT